MSFQDDFRNIIAVSRSSSELVMLFQKLTELIKEGKLWNEAMKESRITKQILVKAIRREGKKPKLEETTSASLERGGEISIMTMNRKDNQFSPPLFTSASY